MFLKNLCRIVTYMGSSKVSPAYSSVFSIYLAKSLLHPVFNAVKSKHTSANLSKKYNRGLDQAKSNETFEGLDQAKSKLILQMNFRSGEDAVPFYKLPIKTLVHVYNVTKNDETKGYCKNRLYYISEKIQHSPSLVSKHLAQRTFVYSLSFDWLKRSLELLLGKSTAANKKTSSNLHTKLVQKKLCEMGVSGDRILRDLWVLKYHHETIKQRLQRVKDMGVDHLYPWMIRCSEDILNRSITISQETKNILGQSKSTQTYLADRLNTTPEAVQVMCNRIPALKTIRVTKVKDFLDFLISEGFEVEDIASKPRILTNSKKTVQQRLEKLRSLGITNINLNVLSRGKKDFKKYCYSMESVKENQFKNTEQTRNRQRPPK